MAGSEQSIVFQAIAIRDPATAAAAASTSQSSSSSSTATSSIRAATLSAAALLGPVLNPLVNPRMAMLVQFPGMTAGGYGGAARAEADFKAIVAQAAGLEGPDWVMAMVTNSTPLVVNATVSGWAQWFGKG